VVAVVDAGVGKGCCVVANVGRWVLGSALGLAMELELEWELELELVLALEEACPILLSILTTLSASRVRTADRVSFGRPVSCEVRGVREGSELEVEVEGLKM
jgi:hypothetical protein